MTFTDRLDNWILSLFPTWGAGRIAARRKLSMVQRLSSAAEQRFSRAYEASDNDRFRGSKWLTSRLSPNSELERESETLRDRAKDLFRNDSFASSAINGRVDNVVGCGIRMQSRIQPGEGVSESRAAELNRQVEAPFRVWARAEKLAQKQRLFERCRGIYGEGFLILSDRGSADKPVPLSIQVIAPERIETPPGLLGDPNVRMGVRLDPATRKPTAYYLRTVHPNDTLETSWTYEEVPADRVVHVFEERFPGQVRGVPWLAPAMADLKDIKDFKETHLIAEQVAACFTVFIEKDEFGDPRAAAEGAASETASDGGRIEDIEPGLIQYLRKGESVKFGDPNRPGNTLGPFLEWHLKAVAAAIRYPFELLVKHYENSYSGGRLSLIDGRIAFSCWQQESIEGGWQRVSDRFVEELVIVGGIDIEPDEFESNRSVFLQQSWVPPGMPWIDPVKEVRGDREAIDGGLSTRSTSLASRGWDYDEVQEQRAREAIDDVKLRLRVEEFEQEERKRRGLEPVATEPDDSQPEQQPEDDTEPAEAAA